MRALSAGQPGPVDPSPCLGHRRTRVLGLLAGTLLLVSCSTDDPVRSSFATAPASADQTDNPQTTAVAQAAEEPAQSAAEPDQAPGEQGQTADEPAQATAEEPSQAAAPEPDGAAGSAPGFPRSFQIGDRIVTVEAEPVRIAALSTDVAEVVLALTGPERMVALPAANATPAIGSHPELAASVPNHIALGDLVDESVLKQWGADLVVISPNHSQEAQLARDLEDSDIAVLTMPNSWDDLEDAYDNILLIGEAVGAEASAQAVVADMKQRARQVAARLDDLDDRPSVLILTNVAGIPFMIGPGVSTTDLVKRAGGSDASHALDVTTSISPITADQIAAAKPDRLLLVDGLGTGRSAYQTLLDSPVVADLPVVADDRILVLPARISFGVAHTLVDGLEAIVDWLHPT